MLCVDLNGKEIQERRDIHKHVAESICHMAETDTTVKQLCCCLVAMSCPTLCSPIDCSPCSSVHELSQARMLELVAFSYSRGSSRPRDRTASLAVYCIAGRFFTKCTTWKAPGLSVGLVFFTRHLSLDWISWLLFPPTSEAPVSGEFNRDPFH